MAWLCSVGGIEIKNGVALGRDVTLDALRKQHDAVFLAIGLTRRARVGDWKARTSAA